MFNINDGFKFNKVILSSADYYVLTQMYLPLIGVNGYAIYTILNNSKDSETTVRHILDLLSLNSVNTFNQAIYKLEACGLLKEYNSDKKLTYLELVLPMSKKNFLANTFLSDYLIGQIGQVEYDSINLSTKKPAGYKEVTKRFDEVFKTGTKNVIIDSNQEEEKSNDIKIKNANFDYLVFKLLVDNRLPSDLLNDEDFTSNILNISYQYKLTEEEMKDAVIKAMTMKNDLTFESVASCAAYIYQSKSNNKVLGFTVKEPVKYEHTLKEDELNLVRMCENSSITSMLENISRGKSCKADINDFNKLANVYNLPDGVINVFIIYLFNVLHKDDPTFKYNYNYLDKVICSWKKQGVTDTKSAIMYMNKLVNEEKTPKAKKSTKVVSEPKWMSEDEKVEELTNEEKIQAETLAKNLLG